VALADNLQGWWCPSLDTSGNGTTTLTDLSGNGNNGTLTNMDAATDWVADTDNGGVRALALSGTSQYVDLGVTPGDFGTTDFAVMCWYKGSAGGNIVVNNDGGNVGINIETVSNVFGNKAQISFRDSVQGAKQFQGADGDINDGTWHCIVVNFDRDANCTVYDDGVSVGSTSMSAHVGNIGGVLPLLIRGRFLQTHRVDGVATWVGRILTSDEITQLYNGGRSLNLLSTGATIVPQLLLRRRRLFGGLVI